MLNKKIIVPVVAAILVALGVNLEQFGINLNDLAGGSNSSNTSNTSNTSSNSSGVTLESILGSQNDTAKIDTSGKTAVTDRYQPGKKWSNTKPALNLHHIFEGEINRSGKPVGYHSRPGGNDADGARIVSIKDKPNRYGVYTANIEIRDGNQWKRKFSSFFPDNMSSQQVTSAILNAYGKSKDKKKQPWQGPSGLGFDIQGYTMSRGDINTAFPIYRRDR